VNKDIKAEKILIEIDDQDSLDSFVNAELESPSPRKIVDGTVPKVTQSRYLLSVTFLYVFTLETSPSRSD
jgi:hypothetical protein